MIEKSPGRTRGATRLDWLNSKHGFSFAEYYDPNRMGFRTLRVINEDVIEPGRGFPTHPHRDMEILSYVLEGNLEHKDSLGNGSVIRPGEVQRMSAGTGIRHSEFNPSVTERVHFLQIWVLPQTVGLEPGYEQKQFFADNPRDQLILVGSRDGREGSLTVHQDLDLYAARLSEGGEVTYEAEPGRGVWIQVALGDLEVNGELLEPGDGLAALDEERLHLRSATGGEVLLFDLG